MTSDVDSFLEILGQDCIPKVLAHTISVVLLRSFILASLYLASNKISQWLWDFESDDFNESSYNLWDIIPPYCPSSVNCLLKQVHLINLWIWNVL